LEIIWKKKNFQVDFIGIGAQKSGTTWIAQCLKEHPQICTPLKKELHFFDKPYNYRKGIDFYASFFDHYSEGELKGEFSPGYLYYEHSAFRINEYFPNVKLIACLRNPIERAYSHYRSASGRGRMSVYKSFEDAVQKNPILTDKSFYYLQLKRFYDLFPEENILVLIYDDLKKDPIKFMKTVYSFLDVDDNFIAPSAEKRIGATGKNKSTGKIPFLDSALHRVWNKINLGNNFGLLYNFVDKTGLRSIGKKLLDMNTKIIEQKLGSVPTKIEDINEEVKDYLKKMYKEDIKQLEILIKKDLTKWQIT